MFTHRAGVCVAATLLATPVVAQQADDYPARAVRVVIPFAPGGPPDVIGRPLLQKLSEAFNQPFVFDNRPGASGTLGTEIVAKSPRDGYTLLWLSTLEVIIRFTLIPTRRYPPQSLLICDFPEIKGLQPAAWRV